MQDPTEVFTNEDLHTYRSRYAPLAFTKKSIIVSNSHSFRIRLEFEYKQGKYMLHIVESMVQVFSGKILHMKVVYSSLIKIMNQ